MIPESAKFIIPQLAEYGIDTPLRICHFLAQVMHECNDFRTVEEGLNYSAKRLSEVWASKFAVKLNAKPVKGAPNQLAFSLERQPIKIANYVYANRYGNGDENSGDGWKYRGRGYMQVTFKDNYKRFGDWAKTDAVNFPDLLITPKYAGLSAVWFWNLKNLNDYADEGSDRHVIESIRKVINGGLNGIEDVTQRFNNIFGG